MPPITIEKIVPKAKPSAVRTARSRVAEPSTARKAKARKAKARKAKGRKADIEHQLFVVGSLRKFTQLFAPTEVTLDAAFEDARERPTTWISTTSTMTDKLLEAASHRAEAYGIRFGDLAMLESPRVDALPGLHNYFGRVSGQVQGHVWLPQDELAEVLTAPQNEARNLFIGGSYDKTTRTLTLTRGDLSSLAVPLSIFKPSGTGTMADPTRLGFTDWGQTVCLGEYEAAADAILYEVDPEFRKELKKKRRQTEKGFGPSLRRLRILKRLTQADFPPLSPRTIARIENSKVGTPHGKTLATIAKTLGVAPEEIESY